LFICSGFVVIVSLVAAAGALTGGVASIWACAAALWFLVGLGMLTIGLFISPLAAVLLASAALLTVARYESGTHESTNY
jgi:cytochrome c biogenesis factor